MQSPHPVETFSKPDDAIRTPFTLHRGQRRTVSGAPVPRDSSPLHSVQALAGAVFVVSVAAGWIAVASTVTAPLVAAGELLSRAARAAEPRA